jgi:flagellar biogenesis protein FliO
MQLKYNRKQSLGSSIAQILLKIVIVLLLLIIGIFLIEKITFPSPEQKFKIEITDEIKKLK